MYAAPMIQPVMAPAPVMMSVPGPNAIVTTCPGCSQKVTTRIKKKMGGGGWIWVGGLCIFLCWPCCLYPFCMSSCKDTDHFC